MFRMIILSLLVGNYINAMETPPQKNHHTVTISIDENSPDNKGRQEVKCCNSDNKVKIALITGVCSSVTAIVTAIIVQYTKCGG